ncbi:hypothetical protein [Falsiroseomonas sp. E2-1-a20]|uniref:hypothetical protein n=1 Tax=Falsiroseomonas sp. E2-1-a20 TaxID=3239300 RepID=UPI003F326D0B
MIRVNVLTGPPGCGKTIEMLVEMTSVTGRYILALPTLDLIGEKLRDLEREAAKSGTEPVVRAIHSGVKHRRSNSVSRNISDAIEEYSSLPHCILVITHEALVQTDFACVAGRDWHIRVDEVPQATVAGQFCVPSSSRFFESSYTLSPVDQTEWYRVSLSSDAPTVGQIMQDDLVKGLAAFHKRIRSPQGVCVDVGDWRDARESNRPVRWCSAWTPAELGLFKTITLAASGFFHSLPFLASRRWCTDEVEFVQREVAGSAARLKPTVRICYFTHGHRASTEWWFPNDPGKAREGKRCLAAVCRYLEGLGDSLGYWSGNGAVCQYFEGRVSGKQVRPKLAGSNEYRDLTSCAYIYSSKAQPNDAVLLDVFGLTREEIERAREREDIWQFVMRGAARMSDFDGTYTVYLYDLWQAEALAEMLRDEGIAEDVTLEAVVEAGILEVARPKPGPVAGTRAANSGKSREEREQERRADDRRRKQAQRDRQRREKALAGTLRSKGRPKASAAHQPGAPG